MRSSTRLHLYVLSSFVMLISIGQAQELRIEYPDIRLGDKRVLTHAKVESFNGLGFCIAHDSGIEPFVRWEIMPGDWQKRFPRNANMALQIADRARAEEAKSRPQPIDLKERTAHPRPVAALTAQTRSPEGIASNIAAKVRPRSELEGLIHQSADRIISQIGRPDSTESADVMNRDRVKLEAQEWVYHGLTRDPISQTVDERTRIIVAHEIEFSATGTKTRDEWTVWRIRYNRD